MRKKRYLILILISVLFALEAKNEVDVVTTSGYAPFCFHKEGMDPALYITDTIPPGGDSFFFRGFAWDILKESFHAAGYTINLTVVPWKRALFLLDRKKADISFPAVKTPGREKKYYFSKELSYPPNHYLIYTLKSRPLDWKGLVSLGRKSIGVIRGYSYGTKWEKYSDMTKLNLVVFDDMDSLFRILNEGTLDAAAGYEFSHEYLINQKGWHDKYKRYFFDESLSYLISPKSSKGRKMLDMFDRGKNIIRSNGKLKKILDKWGFTYIDDF